MAFLIINLLVENFTIVKQSACSDPMLMDNWEAWRGRFQITLLLQQWSRPGDDICSLILKTTERRILVISLGPWNGFQMFALSCGHEKTFLQVCSVWRRTHITPPTSLISTADLPCPFPNLSNCFGLFFCILSLRRCHIYKAILSPW